MNHKRGRCKNRRAGCLMCKPHKMNGWKLSDRMTHNEHKKDVFTEQELKDIIMKYDPTEA